MGILRKTVVIIVLLLLVALCVKGLYAIFCDNDYDRDYKDFKKDGHKKVLGDTPTLVEVQGDYIEVPSTRGVIVTDRHVNGFEGEPVFVDSNGDAYIVKNGKVLASDMYIVADENGYEVRRLDNERASTGSY